METMKSSPSSVRYVESALQPSTELQPLTAHSLSTPYSPHQNCYLSSYGYWYLVLQLSYNSVTEETACVMRL